MSNDKIILVGPSNYGGISREIMDLARDMGRVRVVSLADFSEDLQEQIEYHDILVAGNRVEGPNPCDIEKMLESLALAAEDYCEPVMKAYGNFGGCSAMDDALLKQGLSRREHYDSINPRNSVYRGKIRGGQR
jgi:hypothetical protein